MKHRALLILILTITCLFLVAFPAFAGQWIEQEDEQWQYIDDDGGIVSGWLDLSEGRYYLDEEGYRISGRWSKIARYWYYFDDDGLLATNTWVDNYHVNEEGRKDNQR